MTFSLKSPVVNFLTEISCGQFKSAYDVSHEWEISFVQSKAVYVCAFMAVHGCPAIFPASFLCLWFPPFCASTLQSFNEITLCATLPILYLVSCSCFRVANSTNNKDDKPGTCSSLRGALNRDQNEVMSRLQHRSPGTRKIYGFYYGTRQDKEGGREGTGDFRKKYPADWFWGENLTRKKFGEGGYPALKKNYCTVICRGNNYISRGLEKKNVLTQTKSPIPPSKVK